MVTTNSVCLDRKTRQVHLPVDFPEDDILLEELYNKAAQKRMGRHPDRLSCHEQFVRYRTIPIRDYGLV